MAITFQQQARRRKLIYFGLVVLLLTLQMQHRLVIEARAEENDLRETNIGQVDLGGSAARFALTSFRGPLICALWWEATERQKRHEWNQLELLIRTLAKLQPHFKRPWEYQAWNLAFNVSVEFDRVQDKYFYIAEGTKWLAEGERVNRNRVFDAETNQKRIAGDPDLRGQIAFFFQDKMNLSDEAKIFRCYLPLSCIAPANWDPLEKLSPARNPEELKRFKEQFPQWTRRFREWKKIPEGAEGVLDQEILTFFKSQQEAYRQGRFPSLFRYDPNARRDEDNEQPFPVWPAPEPEEFCDYVKRPANPDNEGVHNSYEIARQWYEYSTIPLPPPEGRRFYEVEQEKKYHRMPKGMLSLLFRKQPAQAKGKMAESFGKEGWFDRTDMETANAQDTWKVAAGMWEKFGHDNGLEVSAVKLKEWEQTAKTFREKYPDLARGDSSPPRYLLENPEVQEGMKAITELQTHYRMKGLANYDHWKLEAETNATPAATVAYRHFYNGGRRRSDIAFAEAEYDRGITAWDKIMTKPRGLDPQKRPDLAGCLAIGPYSMLPGSYVLAPERLIDMTPIGDDRQMQEEIIEMEDGYLRVRARKQSPAWLATTVYLWEISRCVTRQAGAPAALAGIVAGLPSGTVPTSLDDWNDRLEMQPTRLDMIMSPELIFSRGMRAERLQSRAAPPQTQPPQPPQGPPPGQPPSGGRPGAPQGAPGPTGGPPRGQ